ncbi:unnamed protein product [Lactuca virosa]|uniref:Retrotransposon Copia-like N-terminal domain-containing protein n=1 Tax=Lactuca virosa TaxID=75947 RepID=A0AAU9NTQ1_9ASTR|nr:unnamed protein product [Lactuca virosa]
MELHFVPLSNVSGACVANRHTNLGLTLVTKGGSMFIIDQWSMSNANANNNTSGSFSLMNMCQKVTFDGSNFNEWMRYIRMITRYEDKEYVLDEKL